MAEEKKEVEPEEDAKLLAEVLRARRSRRKRQAVEKREGEAVLE